MKRPDGITVTLCMIVKNETHIVHECLESMAPYIDRYDITDTGSTDGTPEKIKEIMDKHGLEQSHSRMPERAMQIMLGSLTQTIE